MDTNNTISQISTIDSSELSNVTGGGIPFGAIKGIVKLGAKAVELAPKVGKFIGKAAVETAGFVGIGAAANSVYHGITSTVDNLKYSLEHFGRPPMG
jgi:hypothetical protein